MSTMIERVARVIDPEAYAVLDAGDKWRILNTHYDREKAKEKARAVIEAMREPTLEMKKVLGSAAMYGTRSNGEVSPRELMSEIVDAALKEKA